MFEAVNACTEQYRPYLGTVTAPAGASAKAAAVSAAHGVLKHYFPANAAALDVARGQSLAAIEDNAAKANGIAVGESAAAALVAARLDDGAAPPETFLPATTDAGVWQPTPPAFGPGILLHWQNVRTFGIERSDQFRSAPPPRLSSRRYARDYDEVMAVGSTSSAVRPQHRTGAARYFAVVSAMDAWNSAARQVITTRRRSLAENAQFFALLNMAISDGLVSSMETKYVYQFWRPVTAIVNGNVDGNSRTEADAAWLPLVTTPAFPSYPSAHASASHAAREVAEELLGTHRIRFELSHPGVPGLRSRTSRLTISRTTSTTRACLAESIFDSIRMPAPFRAVRLGCTWRRGTCGPFVDGRTRPGSRATRSLPGSRLSSSSGLPGTSLRPYGKPRWRSGVRVIIAPAA